MNFHPLTVKPTCTPCASFLSTENGTQLIAINAMLQTTKLHERSPTISRRPECDCRRGCRRRVPSLARMFAVDVISQNGLRSEETEEREEGTTKEMKTATTGKTR